MSTNDILKQHPAWSFTEKRKHNRDSSMFITITRLRERKGGYRDYINHIKHVIKTDMPTAKVTGGTLGYYGSVPVIRVYFNIDDASCVSKLVDIVDANPHDLEIVEVRTPRDSNHADVINNEEITQVIREKLYYGKFRYAVKMKTNTRLSYFDRREAYNQAFSEYRVSADWYNHTTMHINSLEELMLYRMSNDVESVKITEVMLVDEIPADESNDDN